MMQAGEATSLESDVAPADYGTNSHAGGVSAISGADNGKPRADGDHPEARTQVSASIEAEGLNLPPVQLPSPSTGSANDRVAASTAGQSPTVAGSAGRSRAADAQRTKESRVRAWLLKVGPSWLANSDIQKNHKLIVIASFFCVFGITLCTIGAALTSQPPHALYNLVFLIGGFVVLIPGVYYVVYVIRAYKGHDGYAFEDLPPMD